MKDAIGMTWTFQIMIIFILIFSSFLAIYINFSKTYKMKNEVINIIERNEGFTDNSSKRGGTIQLIANYLSTNGYHSAGYCEKDNNWYGATNLDGKGLGDLELAENGKKYHYCVKKIKNFEVNSTNPDKAVYKVKLFLKFDLPVIGNIYTYDVSGETVDIEFPVNDNL